jgi:hypothetical protein
VAQRNFAAGLPHCSELNGTNFYFYRRDRVLNLQDYRRSLDNFVAEGALNPETRRPWNKQDADARWAHVSKTGEHRSGQLRRGREPAIPPAKTERATAAAAMTNRRFPPPWTVEEQAACFAVRR